jgi:type I restriction enzyme, S subunit
VKAKWTNKPLGDLCDILDSKRKPVTKSDRVPGPYPYYGATGIQDFVADFIFDEPLVLVGEDGAKWESGESTAFAVQGKCWVNNHAHVLRPFRDRLLDNWLIYFLNHSDLNEYVSGLTVPKLNQGSLREIRIPLAPIEEQHRIVTLLDEAFADIATAKANAEKNLQNARELFESHLDASFGQRNESWTEKALQDIGLTQTGSTPKTSDQANYGNVLPFIKPGDFAPDGTLNYENDGLSAQGAASARKVSANSVLMVCIGATIGKCGYAEREIATNQQINAFTPVAGVDKKFIYYQMLTKRFQDRVIHSSGQATLPIINKSKWSALTVFLPATLEEQEAIAQKLDAIREETQRLEAIYRQKLNALDDLKKSLLHQAFSGQL